jgi:hypothetical protein
MTYLKKLSAEKYREERAFRAIMGRARRNCMIFAAFVLGYTLGFFTEVIIHAFK